MDILAGFVIVGLFISSIVFRIRVIASKRYATYQRETPDLDRFAGESCESTNDANGTSVTSDVAWVRYDMGPQ